MTKIGAAAVITDDRRRVLLVHHTYGELNWEIPGGLGEDDESADQNTLAVYCGGREAHPPSSRARQ